MNPRYLGMLGRAAALLPLAALILSGVTCRSDRGSYPTRDGATTPALKSDGGTLQITASVNNCPVVTFVVTPPDAKVGEQMDVSATAFDPDSGDQLSYAWTAGAGSFGDSKAAHTTYRCPFTGAGPQTIVLVVSDGTCSVTRTAAVFCFATGVQMGTGGVAGRAGMGGAAGTVGSAGMGAGGRGGSGGVGQVDGSGGRVGGGGTGGTVAPACVRDPTHDEGAACEACTKDNCIAATDSCDGLNSDAKVAACQRLYCCIRAKACALDPIRGVLNCWCGSVDNDLCWTINGAANGPCLVEMQEAADSTDAPTIKQRFVDPSFPLGRANNLATCRSSYCSDPMTGSDPPAPACKL